MLYREPMWLKFARGCAQRATAGVSVLYREPMWLKFRPDPNAAPSPPIVSVLYREPMWLKSARARREAERQESFSALP